MPFLIGLAAFAALLVLIQVGAVSVAFDRLGLTTESGMLLLLACVIGSLLNMPLFRLRTDGTYPMQRPAAEDGEAVKLPAYPVFCNRTVVAVNVGGAVIPVAFCAWLLLHMPLSVPVVLLAVVIQTAVCYLFSRPVAGLGIGMPILVAPVAAAVLGVSMGGDQAAPLAYVAGTLGVLLGCDLLRLRDIRRLHVPLAAIGGAGTFDGVFITGIIAVILT